MLVSEKLKPCEGWRLGAIRGILEELKLDESTFSIDEASVRAETVSKPAVSYPGLGCQYTSFKLKAHLNSDEDTLRTLAAKGYDKDEFVTSETGEDGTVPDQTHFWSWLDPARWERLCQAQDRSSFELICFVPEATLHRLQRIPRRGSDADYTHALTGHPNDNVHQPLSSFDKDETCFVFISHRWLRPGDRLNGHPDNDEDDKCRLILQALSKLRGEKSPVPAGVQFAVWIEYAAASAHNLTLTLTRPSGSSVHCALSPLLHSASFRVLSPLASHARYAQFWLHRSRHRSRRPPEGAYAARHPQVRYHDHSRR
jgi:hypothetical protein